jgi:hypothetical protein
MSNFETMSDGIWTTVNNVEECTYKIKNVANVLEIMAVAEIGDITSGALWLMRDNLMELTDKIELYTQDLLDCRRELMEEMNKPKVFAYEPKTSTIKPKKGKKK